MNTSTEAIKGQITSQIISTNKDNIAKEENFGHQSALVLSLLASAYGQLKEFVITISIVAGVLAISRLIGLYRLWIQFIERVVP